MADQEHAVPAVAEDSEHVQQPPDRERVRTLPGRADPSQGRPPKQRLVAGARKRRCGRRFRSTFEEQDTHVHSYARRSQQSSSLWQRSAIATASISSRSSPTRSPRRYDWQASRRPFLPIAALSSGGIERSAITALARASGFPGEHARPERDAVTSEATSPSPPARTGFPAAR